MRNGTVFGNSSVGDGTWLVCTLNNARNAGTYSLAIRYQSYYTNTRPITVNGVNTPPNPGLVYPNTGASFATITTPITLRAGANTIVIDSSYFTLDWIEIS